MKFAQWFFGHIHLPYVLTPVGTLNLSRTVSTPLGTRQYTYGYTDVFVFGVRIARIWRVKPWE